MERDENDKDIEKVSNRYKEFIHDNWEHIEHEVIKQIEKEKILSDSFKPFVFYIIHVQLLISRTHLNSN